MSVDPFTRTPGIAGEAYIDMHYAETVIENFESSNSSKFIYKIVGLRGSGKSVEYGKIIKHFSDNRHWLVYTLSAAGNPTETLIAKLSKEKFINASQHTSTINVEADIIKTAEIAYTRTSEPNANYYSQEAEMSEMLKKADSKGYKVLIGVDDISKSEEMVKFLSIIGSIVIEQHNVFFICTGLSKNIEDFAEDPSLTFFKRSDTIEIKSLNKYEITTKYEDLLKVSHETAVSLALFVKGYAYAYQVLGSLFFNKKSNEALEDIIPQFDKVLSQDSYDLIWKSLTVAEKELVKCILNSSSGKVSEIKSAMSKPQNFESLRERLSRKHIINTEIRGYLSIDLPRFKEYVSLWG